MIEPTNESIWVASLSASELVGPIGADKQGGTAEIKAIVLRPFTIGCGTVVFFINGGM